MTKRELGFGVVEMLVILVVLVAVGGVGWYIWQAQTNKTQTTTPPVSIDVYTDWKVHCDDESKACFKYPADWTLTQSEQNGMRFAELANPAKTVNVTYMSEDTRDGAVVPYYPAFVKDLAKADTRFKVQGGFVSGVQNPIPHVRVVDSKILTDHPLTVGTVAPFADTARFTQTNGNSASFSASPVGTLFTEQTAKDWFATEDANTARLVVESFYLY